MNSIQGGSIRFYCIKENQAKIYPSVTKQLNVEKEIFQNKYINIWVSNIFKILKISENLEKISSLFKENLVCIVLKNAPSFIGISLQYFSILRKYLSDARDKFIPPTE